MKSHSQLEQDLNIIYFFDNLKNGYFVDIGAYDGIRLSNTYILEKEFNWNGICSEPMPVSFNKLIKCRNVDCDNNAVFNKNNLKLKFSVSEMGSGITEYINHHTHIKKKRQITVNTITINDLLDKYKSPNIIHYLSLDTEGSELEILKILNFEKYKFLYINLEHNFVEPQRTNIKNLLLSNGYLYKGENKWDDDYIHEINIIGNYYLNNNNNNNKDNKIEIKKIDNNIFKVTSILFDEDIGNFDNGFIIWKKLGKCEIFYDKIIFNNNNKWYKNINY